MKIMNPEERFERIECQLEFVAGIQAQLCVSQQRQDSEIAQNARQISQLAEIVSNLVRVVDGQGNRMEAGFRRMEERQERTDEQMRRTDERLNTLIAAVERRNQDAH